MSTPPIGSASWDDGYQGSWYEDFDVAVSRCFSETRWDRVMERCSRLRSGIKCTMSHKMKHGDFNLVKLVEFEDGVKWIFRTPIDYGSKIFAAKSTTKIRIEVATYKYLKERTSIPVPEVYAYSAEVDRDIGSPFMLLEYLHGTIATDFDLDNDQLGHVHRQLAAIIIELATHKFNKIGSLILDDSGDFAIGTDIETDKGPFNTALEFYNTISKHRFRSTTEHVFYDNLEAEQCKESLYLPFLFNNLMPIFTDCADDHGPFSLTNPDLGFHNILLDGNLNIVGMIDCDMVLAAPIHVVAQVSHLAKLERPPPGLRIRDERGREGYEKGIEQFVKFVEMLKTVEERFECGNAISEAFVSDAAALYRGLNDYRYEEPGLGTWHQSYLYMYYHKIKGPGYAQEFSERHIWSDDSNDDKDEAEDTAAEERQQSEPEDVEDSDCRGHDNDSGLQDHDWGQQNNPSRSQSVDLDSTAGCDPDDNWGMADNKNSPASTVDATDEFGKGADNQDQDIKTGQGGSAGLKDKTVDLAGWAMALVGGFLNPVEALLEVYESCMDKLDPLAMAVRWVEAEV